MDASGRPHLVNRGDASNPYPGTKHIRSFGSKTTPDSRLFVGTDTHIAVNEISDAATTMSMKITVKL